MLVHWLYKTAFLVDRRNAKRKLKSLAYGHSHCIKNLEYDPQLRYLVSSGLDGAVIVWDLFSSSSDQLEPGFTRVRWVHFGMSARFLEEGRLMFWKTIFSLNSLIQIQIR